jgi:hypothetical protein
MKGIHSILLIYLKWLKCVTSSAADRCSAMPALLAWSGLLCITFSPATAQAQTVLSETTWGGEGSDASEGVAIAADGASYMVGITDSFTRDPFGNPSPRIFLVKFASDGSLIWQRIWNGTTVRGIGRTGVALGDLHCGRDPDSQSEQG